MTPCAQTCPAVDGLACERFHGHRDHHAVRVTLPDGREVRIEWTVYDARALAAPTTPTVEEIPSPT